MKKNLPAAILRIAALIVLLPFSVWSTGAAHFTLFGENIILTAAAGVVLFCLWFTALFLRRAVFVSAAANAGIMIYFLLLTPAHCFSEVTWQTPWKRRPRSALLEGNRIKFYDVRDFRYRAENDMIVRYKTITYSLDDLQSVDLAVSHWDGLESIAHTMLAFNFSTGAVLVLSMETRIPEGKVQSGLAGLFKQYEIIPVLGTPEDIFDLRIRHRGEDFYLYRTRATPEQARKMLLAAALYVNRPPVFYNTVTRNCSTSFLPLIRVLELDPIDDIRLLLNGYSDQLLYRLGYLVHDEGETFGSLKNRSYISGKSRGHRKN